MNFVSSPSFNFQVKEVITGFSSDVEYQATENGIVSCFAGGTSGQKVAYIQVGDESGNLTYKAKDYSDATSYHYSSYPIKKGQFFKVTANGDWEKLIEFLVI